LAAKTKLRGSFKRLPEKPLKTINNKEGGTKIFPRKLRGTIRDWVRPKEEESGVVGGSWSAGEKGIHG